MKRRVLIGAVLCVIAACGPAGQSTTARSHTPGPTPASSPTAPSSAVITVLAAGAAPGALGVQAFAVVRNVETSGPVQNADVTLRAVSDNGFADVTVTMHITAIGPGTTRAVAGDLAIPEGDSISKVSGVAVATGPSARSEIPLDIGTPVYHSDPIQPQATVRIASGTGAVVDLVVVCWSHGGDIVGGAVDRHLTLRARAASSITLPLALREDPQNCTAYAGQ